MKFGKFFFRCANSIVELAVLTCILLLAGFGCYGIWDSNQIYQEADKARYEEYRPGEETLSFEELRRLNEEVFGWLTVYGTNIDYPLVQAEDNEKYVNTDASGEFSLSGALFLDYRNEKDFSDFNSIIYGHHMKNGSMFSGLTEYKKQEFYDSHSVALLLTPDKNYEIEFFAGYVASVQDKAWELAFPSDPDFTEWLDKTKERSCFTSGITPAVTDRILTLSTCSYEFNNARFVLLGVLKPEE